MVKNQQTIREKVEELMDKKIKPTIQMDGGDINLVDVDESTGVVTVQLAGACVGCALSSVTLTLGVERELLENIPEFSHLEVIEENE